jgi:hypothetical protein
MSFHSNVIPSQVTGSDDAAHPTAVTNSRKEVVTILGVEEGGGG